MPGFSLRQNMDFEWDGAAYRIQQINDQGQVMLIRRSDARLSVVETEELLAAFLAGKLRKSRGAVDATSNDMPAYGRPMVELPVRVQQEVNRRRHYIEFVAAQGTPKYSPAYLVPIIEQAAKEYGDSRPPSPVTVYRWSRRLQHANEQRSLIPRIDLRGPAKARQAECSLAWLREAMEDAFRQSPGAACNDIYIRWKARIDRENYARTHSEQVSVPSKRTCYRLLAKVEMYDRIVLKEGQTTANRRLKIVLKGVSTTTIFERVEIDHTPLDLFVIDDRTWLPLGRPTLTIVLDHFSRMVLGYYLSFGGTSAHAALAALRHAILPKVPAVATIQGIEVKHRWPCYGVMDSIVLDNGTEFHGGDFDAAAFDLGIRLQYCPKHTPWFKGAIERFLKTLNHHFVHQLPGTSFARLADRGDYDPTKHAVLTMVELIHVLEKWILDIYAQSLHRGINMTPWAKWNEGLSRRIPVLPHDRQQLQRRIGKTTERSLRKTGIELNTLFYNGPTLQDILDRYGDGVRVKVVFDEEDLGAIQVWAPDAADPVEVPAIHHEYATGLTRLQHDLIRAQAIENGRQDLQLDALHAAKLQLTESIAHLMESRKQRDRRKAARAHGKTSTHPQRELPVNQPAKPVAPKKAFKGADKPAPAGYTGLDDRGEP